MFGCTHARRPCGSPGDVSITFFRAKGNTTRALIVIKSFVRFRVVNVNLFSAIHSPRTHKHIRVHVSKCNTNSVRVKYATIYGTRPMSRVLLDRVHDSRHNDATTVVVLNNNNNNSQRRSLNDYYYCCYSNLLLLLFCQSTVFFFPRRSIANASTRPRVMTVIIRNAHYRDRLSDSHRQDNCYRWPTKRVHMRYTGKF